MATRDARSFFGDTGIAMPAHMRSSQATAATHKPDRVMFDQRVKNAFASGRTNCDNVLHFKWNNGVVTKDYKDILDLMMPGVLAKCPCEMNACKWMWGRKWTGRWTSEVIPSGLYQKGIPNHCGPKDRIMKVVHVPYKLSPDNFKQLSEDFPNLYIMTGDGDHDHPIAHTRNKIVAAAMVEGLRRGTKDAPKRYLDLYGNPGSNANNNARIEGLQVDTVVELVTGKDYIRAAERWGDDWQDREDVFEATMRDYSVLDNAPPGLNPANYDGFVAIQTLYYQQLNEIAALLGKAKRGAVYHAIVHRHDKAYGSLNKGEQTYVKTQGAFTANVKQTNKDTGAVYSHPACDWLFENDGWVESMESSKPGLAWDVELACADFYKVKIVSVPAKQARMSERCLIPGEPTGLKVLEDVVRRDGAVEFPLGTRLVRCENIAPGTYEEMRLHVSGKARTAAQFKDHLASVKRKVKQSGERGDATATAIASFFTDFDKDRHLIAGSFAEVEAEAAHLSNVLEGVNPMGAKNLIDKALLLGAFAIHARQSKDSLDTLSRGFRLAKSLVNSNGTKGEF